MSYISKDGVVKVVRDALVIIRGIKHSGLYELQGETMMHFAAKRSNAFVRQSELWYMCLEHISKKSLKVLSERNLLHGYVANKLNVCRCCDLD